MSTKERLGMNFLSKSRQSMPKGTELLLRKIGLQLPGTALVPGLAYKRQGKAGDIAPLKLELPARTIFWSPRVKTPSKVQWK